MEWYYDSAMEDLTVPNDDQMFDRNSSPGRWSSWGKRAANFNSQNKFNTEGIENFLFSGDTFYSEAENCSPRNCQLSSPSFSQQSSLAQSNVQVNNFSGSDEADDIFLRSLFKTDSSETQGGEASANFSPTSNWNDFLSVNDNGESNNVQDCSNNVEEDSSFVQKKDPKYEIGSSEHLNVSEYINEDEETCMDDETCMDESVLMELQMSSLQLREETRICFRDSLYRLAENSRQQTSCSQNATNNCKTVSGKSPSSLDESNVEESNTNAIDRTVATLLFNTMKFCNIALASRLDLNEKSTQKDYGVFSFEQESSIGGDAEVPT